MVIREKIDKDISSLEGRAASLQQQLGRIEDEFHKVVGALEYARKIRAMFGPVESEKNEAAFDEREKDESEQRAPPAG